MKETLEIRIKKINVNYFLHYQEIAQNLVHFYLTVQVPDLFGDLMGWEKHLLYLH